MSKYSVIRAESKRERSPESKRPAAKTSDSDPSPFHGRAMGLQRKHLPRIVSAARDRSLLAKDKRRPFV